MATDDPRLNKLIVEGSQGEIVIVGCPYDFLRKRSSGKGGEDNGPCCLRRFYPKVEYSIDITGLKVSDMGNITIQISKQQQQQKFKNVSSKRFKGQFVNYYKESPQKIIQHISTRLQALIKNNQIPFVFGGSKQGLLASIDAFHNVHAGDSKIIYILTGLPLLERPYDGDKATSNNICSVLNIKYPKSKFKIFGPQLKYCPPEYVTSSKQNLQINKQKLPNFQYITYQEIRRKEVNNKDKKLGYRTQALHKFIQIYNQNQFSQIHISLQVLELFNGCRDISIEGLQFDQLTQIMFFLGQQDKIKTISINQFNPSCQDYQSSLIILNAFYYYLLGKSYAKTKGIQ